ncbi:sugar ABC transporter permease [Clostridium beijerinckii]|uniref:sugar ABC transporter permease n=1 Tax=Clostridium beijerinckii TaxID=1520 RepID=UPI001494DFD6|nr:ABC transporter permease subunit [Clostridium beijerinckii]NOW06682.1 arabinogalactan oligomer/maltooligosaccharide transport system permease protein [Clostridium beijerinckii]NYC00174.1 arabinogalactan oligomer/maltooligosaccharide transport system permease protein [Clostridium beijerinckii]
MQANAQSINIKTINKTDEKLLYKKKLIAIEKRELWFQRIFLWIFIAIIFFPILCVIGASLGTGDSFFTGTIFTETMTLDNYKEIFTSSTTDFTGAFIRTFIVCGAVGGLQIIMTVTAAYAISRMRFKGRKYGLLSLLILQMFPSTMTISAIYYIVSSLELQGSMIALIFFLAGGSAFNVWLLKNYMDGIPKELDESAKVDGATHNQIFIKIILPLAKPMIAVMFFFSVQGTYNEFIISNMILNTPETQTIMCLLRSFINGNFNQHWTIFAAGSVVSSIPLVILFMFLQKYIEKGLVAGAVKG